ncbi:hypothetical protein ACJMK2_027861 [Sinanodonta woodiana]|uniref:Sulfotransferase domain-containing protein n=1 Tax=Sinanodonta woodiana TaxID=1069815 RepID=A0ABD3X6S9_SINWO
MKATHRVTKILRIGLDIGLTLMERTPNLKIVYLVRDPRGVLFSRIMTPWFPVFENDTKTLINNIVTHCDKMRTDLLKLEEIEYLYPDRIMTVYFEEIAEDHFKAMKKVYNFINLTYNIVDKVNMDKMFVDMRESNHKWRWSMNWTYVHWVDELCSDTYERLGYKIIPSEDTLRNMSIHSWIRPLKKGFKF